MAVYMRTTETVFDWTAAEGTSQPFTIFQAPPGWCIYSPSMPFSAWDSRSYTDTDHDSLNGQADSFVDYYAIVGDTDG